MKIIFLSHTARKSVFKVGSYHLSNQYSMMGHEVLYVSSPISLVSIIKNIVKLDFSTLFQKLKLTKGVKENNIINYIPFTLLPYVRLPIFDSLTVALKTGKYVLPSIGRVLSKHNFKDADLVLIDDPSLAFMKDYINCDNWVYRITDIYSEMPNSRKSILEVEKLIYKKLANQIITTSAPVSNFYIKEFGNVHKSTTIENGVDYEFFQRETQVPSDYEEGDNARAVYIGSFDGRFDWELFYNAVESNKDIAFYLIGPLDKSKKLKEYKNMHYLGTKDYKEIPRYLKHADIGLLPFTQSLSNEGRSPMKLYEYGAAGLPVIATTTNELKRRNLPFVYLSDTSDAFSVKIRQALTEAKEIKKIASYISKEHSWQNKAEQILQITSGKVDTVENNA